MNVADSPEQALAGWTTQQRVAICIPDATRPLNAVPALQALCKRIAEPHVWVGLGLHRRMLQQELAPLQAWEIQQSDPDDVVTTKVVNGISGTVTRGVAECDFSLSVGVCEPHQYAGFSGGHKGVAVGCGGRETIAALHRRDLVMHPGVRLGSMVDNPFRDTVDALGRAARCQKALCFVPGPKVWLFGEPTEVVKHAASLSNPWTPVDRRYQTVLLRVPPAKATSLYQASRAATYLALSPHPPIHPGARLILDASCPEGLGAETGFRQALSRGPAPWQGLLTEEEPRGPGAQRAIMLALMAQQVSLEVWGCVDPAPLLAVGIPATQKRPQPQPDWLVVDQPFVRIPQAPCSDPAPVGPA